MNKIPKVINYCWFGGKPVPDKVRKNIESWKKYCPDFEIKQWNEKNFNVGCCKYVKQAFEKKKWAFVSDYARFWILYNNGGIYFDTDVELIRPLDKIYQNGAFMAREKSSFNKYKYIARNKLLAQYKALQVVATEQRNQYTYNDEYVVNPGLGMGAYPKMEFYKEILEIYNNSNFILNDGSISPVTVVDYTTTLAIQYGLSVCDDDIEVISRDKQDIVIYSTKFFCPIDYTSGMVNITDQTIGVHHYDATWLTNSQKYEKKVIDYLKKHKVNNDYFIKIIILPIRMVEKLQLLGLKKTITFVFNKVFNVKDKQ